MEWVTQSMAEVKVTAFRFSDEELELLDVIQGHTGIRSRMDALRRVLRYYAESAGPPVDNSDEPRKPQT